MQRQGWSDNSITGTNLKSNKNEREEEPVSTSSLLLSQNNHHNNRFHGCSFADLISHRLHVVEEIEILTSSDLLQRYDHVWRNAHWFDGVQTIYPLSHEKEKKRGEGSYGRNHREATTSSSSSWGISDDHSCPSVESLVGVKKVQESLLLYKLEPSEGTQASGVLREQHEINRSNNSSSTASFSQSQSSSFLNRSPETIAMVDICSRLINAAKQTTTTAVINSGLQVNITLSIIDAMSYANKEIW